MLSPANACATMPRREKRAFKQAGLQAANVADGQCTTAVTLALDDRRLQDLQRLHGEVADSDRLLADSDA
jgi:hypothetical protein